MRSKAEKYYERVIGGDEPPFQRWPFRRVIAEKRIWKTRISTVYIWIDAIDKKLLNTQVHSGTTIRTRKKSNRRSRPRRMIFYMMLPPYRNYSSNKVKQILTRALTTNDRCMTGMNFANKRALGFRIAPEIAKALIKQDPLLGGGGGKKDLLQHHLLADTNESSGIDS